LTYHVCVGLPDGRRAIADYREPVVRIMRRVNDAIAIAGPGSMAGTPDDYAIIAAWVDANQAQVDRCAAHLSPNGPACGHD
jgi:hypothetical protein